MKLTKHLVVLLLCFSLFALFCTTAYAADGETNLYADVYADVELEEVEIGDYIYLNIYNSEMKASGIKAGFYFDNTKLEIIYMSWEIITAENLTTGKFNKKFLPTVSTEIDQANDSGSALGVYAINSGVDSRCQEGTVVCVVFEVIAEGDATITLREETVGTDAFKSDSIDPITITIGSSEPACGHENTKLVPKGNGHLTHNVVCQNPECGAIVEEKVPCTVDPSKTTYYEDPPANCCSAGKQWKVTYCACGSRIAVTYDKITPVAGEHTLEKYEQKGPTCNSSGHKEYWRCAKSDYFYENEAGTIKIEDLRAWLGEDGDGYLPVEPDNHGVDYGFHYDSNGSTHTKYCNVCNVAIKGEIDVRCSGGTATCYEYAVCEVCGWEYGELSEHFGGTETCAHGKICENCREEYTEPTEEHTGEQIVKPIDDRYHAIFCSVCKLPWVWDEEEEEESIYVLHVAEENGYCECGVFAFVLDLNGGHFSQTSPDPDEVPDEVWKEMVEDMFGSLHATAITYFYSEAFDYPVEPEEFAFWNLMVVREGYKLVGYAYNKEGTQPYNGDVITGPTTLYLVWESTHVCGADDNLTHVPAVEANCKQGGNIEYWTCECEKWYSDSTATTEITDKDSVNTPINENNHAAGGAAGAENNGDGTHTLTRPCGHDIVTEPHNFNEFGHCICGVNSGWYYAADDYWYYYNPVNNQKVTGLTRVPYNAKLGHAANPEDLDYNPNFKDASEAWYLFDEDGKLVRTTGIVDNKYYADGVQVWHPGFVTVEGELYYFVGDAENGGNKLANGEIYVTRINGITGFTKGDVYNFVDGQLSGLNGIANGKYYENSKLMMGAGLVEIEEGKYIYVRSNGQLAVGQYWITKTNGKANAGMYTFDEDGILQSAEDPSVNGIVEGVYYKNGVPYYAGLIEIDGDVYYVKSNGEVVTGTYYVTKTNGLEGFTSGDKLVFDKDGKMEPIKNGIVDGCYYINNRVQYGAGLIELEDGSIIYVRSNGQLAVGEYYITNANGLEGYKTGDKLVFDENGKLVK